MVEVTWDDIWQSIKRAMLKSAGPYYDEVAKHCIDPHLTAFLLSAYAPDKVTPEIAQMAARKMYAGIRAPAFDTDGWGELDHARKELLTSSMTAALLAAFAVLRGDQIERTDNAPVE
jgi:hypothetical protein